MQSVTSNAVALALDGKTIKHKTISGTTNQYGVIYKGNSNLLGTERIINSYLANGNDDYFCLSGSSPTNGQWIQIRNYLNTVKSNSSVEVEIIYF